ncbi:hypothetical protein L1987_33079 [Smallanthus sonchifolius]|uniref:Uncharacterized protein n=1 Tax=Smallanthus sonchifolius TaxID=185202 RepID=A0ACB9HRF3_9ASTR|nr:hypothetical protein L1987_33079 [Smallanthus sonchifolius]
MEGVIHVPWLRLLAMLGYAQVSSGCHDGMAGQHLVRWLVTVVVFGVGWLWVLMVRVLGLFLVVFVVIKEGGNENAIWHISVQLVKEEDDEVVVADNDEAFGRVGRWMSQTMVVAVDLIFQP